MSTELAFHDQKLYKVFARETGTKQGLLILMILQTGQLSHFKCVVQNTLKTSRMRQYSNMNTFHTSHESRVPVARFETLACCLTELHGSVDILLALHKTSS